MKPIDDNVILDSVSQYGWETLNESLYLTRFFEELKQQMGYTFRDYNYYVFSSHNPDAVPSSAALSNPRKILFFISDESSSIPFQLAKSYSAIFKSYIPREVNESNIYPFNIGYVADIPEFDVKPSKKRGVDVFFLGNLNKNRFALYREVHPIFRWLPARNVHSFLNRVILTNYSRSMRMDFSSSRRRYYIKFTDKFKVGLPPQEYARVLYDSKIVLCPRGFHSCETFRHIESMRAGCIIISEPLPDTYLYRNSPIISVTNWREGFKAAKNILRDESLLADLQSRTLTWWKNVCSETATAKYVSEKICRLAVRTG